jgi:hypothetical protein
MKKLLIFIVLFAQTLLLAIIPPNDPMFSNQWNLLKINIMDAWK